MGVVALAKFKSTLQSTHRVVTQIYPEVLSALSDHGLLKAFFSGVVSYISVYRFMSHRTIASLHTIVASIHVTLIHHLELLITKQ